MIEEMPQRVRLYYILKTRNAHAIAHGHADLVPPRFSRRTWRHIYMGAMETVMELEMAPPRARGFTPFTPGAPEGFGSNGLPHIERVLA